MNGASDRTASESSRLLAAPYASMLSIAMCCAALALTLLRLPEFDFPLTRFVRSLNDHYIDHLRHPWLAWLSDVGDQVGGSEFLLCVSALLLAVGYAYKLNLWKIAGWDTLVVHAVAGVASTALKHFVGRARPKFMHVGVSEFSPFAGNGWDSFPSGHTTCSFAIATVLAVRFPKLRWGVFGIALAISASRLLRGSHFLTDIIAGAVLGVLIAVVVVHRHEWRTALGSALYAMTPPLAVLLAVITAIGHPLSDEWAARALTEAGLLLAWLALLILLLMKVRPALFPIRATRAVVLALIGLGLGMCSGSVWVTTVALLTGFAHGLRAGRQGRPDEPPHFPWYREAALGLGLLLSLYTMLELRGALPLG
jgi:membrane-associated phospholipid phosphatase